MGWSSPLNRVAAGVATPMLSMLFYEVGDALRSHDGFALAPQFVLGQLVVAGIFGAPFSVPVSLAIRLRNTWTAVPFISAVAAIGIGLQIEFGRHVPDTSPCSVYLMLIWLVPAALGTVAALLLKWHRAPSSLAITAVAVALVAILTVLGLNEARRFAPIYAAAASWSKLRVGMNVYTSQESILHGQTVCPTVAALLASQRSDSERCRIVAAGTPAIVDAIVPCKKNHPNWGYESAHVKLHARNGSWHGFSEAGSLQPDVPVGTLIDMERDWGAPLALENDRGVPTDIGASALVRVLRYDPKREVSLYVKILDGPFMNRTGWMGIQDAYTGGVALGEYDMEYPYEACEK